MKSNILYFVQSHATTCQNEERLCPICNTKVRFGNCGYSPDIYIGIL